MSMPSSLRCQRQAPALAERHDRRVVRMRCVVPSWKAITVSIGIAALAGIDRLDDVGVFLADHAAADLARAGELAVVGVELLVEQQELGDALRRRQRGVDRSRPRRRCRA